ncbi:MAG: peptidylprolyl isomerase [Candidatus Marinimicrobia bacterium]|nr:peptidylprolyl isomerase [Candidatus Neomarinimicrobiota bacterium]
MKKLLVSILMISLMIVGCGKKTSGPKYEEGSKEYHFFELLSEQVPSMAPDTTVELITTNDFVVVNHDVMPLIFQAMKGDTASFVSVNTEQIVSYINRVVSGHGNQQLLLAEADKHNVKVSKEEVEEELEKIFTRYGGEEKFTEMVELQDMTIENVKEDLEDNLLVNKYFKDEIFSKIKVDEAKVKERYELGKNNYDNEVATVRHILFLTNNKSDEEKVEVKALAEEVLAKAKDGEDFEKLVEKYTEDPGSKENGGLYEDFSKGRMVKPFEDVAFNAEIGSISDLVVTQYGYHIIKVIDRKDSLTFEDVKEEIKEQLKKVQERSVAPVAIDSLKELYEYKELLNQ